MADQLDIALVRTRHGYAEERLWHRFLVDSYTGGGGFAGRIGSPESELGSIATVYPPCEGSYLDRYPREDVLKFARRVKIAHYVNYIEPLTDLKCGLALAKPYTIENLPAKVLEWCGNVDGLGTSFAVARSRLVRRAALVGWAPVLVDMPLSSYGVETQAQAQAAGLSPRLVPLYPGNLTEWHFSDGSLEWVKVRNDFCERESFDGDESKYSIVDVWQTDSVRSFRLVDRKVASADEIPRSGPIPLTVLRHKEAEDDPMIGLPMNGQVAIEARRLFNLMSALDEALDASCFPLLVMVDSLDPNSDAPDGGGEVTIGAGNAITLPKDATKQHYYLAPPSEVFDAFEKRIEETVREMYRQGRVEFVRPAGSQNESGIARKYAFQQTNTAIGSFAQQIAAWEQDTYRVVARLLGVPDADIEQIRVIPPDEFDVDDIEAALKQAELAFAAKLGPTFNATLRKRLAQEILPNVSDDVRATIDDEIDAEETDAAAASAFTAQTTIDPFANQQPPTM